MHEVSRGFVNFGRFFFYNIEKEKKTTVMQ